MSDEKPNLDALAGSVYDLEQRVSALEAERVTREGDPVTPDDREDKVATPVDDGVVRLSSERGEIRVGRHGMAGIDTRLDVPLGEYTALELDMTVALPHDPAPTDDMRNLVWIYRRREGQVWRGSTLAYLLHRGPGRNIARLVTVMGDDPRAVNERLNLGPDKNRVRVVYRWDRGQHGATIFTHGHDAVSIVLLRGMGEPGVLDVIEGDDLMIQFGMEKGQGAEVPSPDWEVVSAELTAWRA